MNKIIIWLMSLVALIVITESALAEEWELAGQTGRSISINFHNGTAITGTATSGFFPIARANWSQKTGTNGTLQNLKVVKADGTVDSTLTGASAVIEGAGGSYVLNANANDPILTGYIDENASRLTPTVTISGIPFARYRVIVYTSTDTANANFGHVTIGETNYSAVDGKTVAGRTTVWGNAGPSNNSLPLGEGTNFLISQNIVSPSVTIIGHRGSTDTIRGCIAAIQIIELPYVYTATVAGNSTIDWSAITWTKEDTTVTSPGLPTGALCELTVTGNPTITFDAAASSVQTIASLTIKGSTPTFAVKNVPAPSGTYFSKKLLNATVKGVALANVPTFENYVVTMPITDMGVSLSIYHKDNWKVFPPDSLYTATRGVTDAAQTLTENTFLVRTAAGALGAITGAEYNVKIARGAWDGTTFIATNNQNINLEGAVTAKSLYLTNGRIEVGGTAANLNVDTAYLRSQISTGNQVYTQRFVLGTSSWEEGNAFTTAVFRFWGSVTFSDDVFFAENTKLSYQSSPTTTFANAILARDSEMTFGLYEGRASVKFHRLAPEASATISNPANVSITIGNYAVPTNGFLTVLNWTTPTTPVTIDATAFGGAIPYLLTPILKVENGTLALSSFTVPAGARLLLTDNNRTLNIISATVTGYIADVSEDIAWSDIRWVKDGESEVSANLPATAVCVLRVTGNPSITFDASTPVAIATLNLEGTGLATFEVSSIPPQSISMFTLPVLKATVVGSAIATVAETSDDYNLIARISSETGLTVSGTIINARVISVNVIGGHSGTAGDSVERGTVGLLPVEATYWENILNQKGAPFTEMFSSFTEVNIVGDTKTSTLRGIDLSTAGACTYRSGVAATSGNGELAYGYIDDGETVAGENKGAKVELSGIPYTKYAVIVYFGSDGDGSFGPVNVNGTWKTWRNGMLVDGATAWGSRAASRVGDVTWTEGVNCLRFEDQTNQTFTVYGSKTGYPGGTRTGIAGIQIICTGDLKAYTAEIDADSDWEDIVWQNAGVEIASSELPANAFCELMVTGTPVIKFDGASPVTIEALKLLGDGEVSFTAKNVTHEIGSVVTINQWSVPRKPVKLDLESVELTRTPRKILQINKGTLTLEQFAKSDEAAEWVILGDGKELWVSRIAIAYTATVSEDMAWEDIPWYDVKTASYVSWPLPEETGLTLTLNNNVQIMFDANKKITVGRLDLFSDGDVWFATTNITGMTGTEWTKTLLEGKLQNPTAIKGLAPSVQGYRMTAAVTTTGFTVSASQVPKQSSISINFDKLDDALLDDTFYGVEAILGKNWNKLKAPVNNQDINIENMLLGDVLKDAEGGETPVIMSYDGRIVENDTQTANPYPLLRGALVDYWQGSKQEGGYPRFVFSNIPYARYDVIVYQANTAWSKNGAVQVNNGSWYVSDAFGNAVVATETSAWEVGGSQTLTTLAAGRNYMRIKGLSDATLRLTFKRVNGSQQRANICAIQIVSTTQSVEAQVNGDTSWTGAAWTPAVPSWKNRPFYAQVTTVSESTLTVDANLALSTLATKSYMPLTVVTNGTASFQSGAIDDSASTNRTTFGFSTGDAQVLAGMDTRLPFPGTGRLTIEQGKRATLEEGWRQGVLLSGTLAVTKDCVVSPTMLASCTLLADNGATMTVANELLHEYSSSTLLIDGVNNGRVVFDYSNVALAMRTKGTIEIAPNGTLDLSTPGYNLFGQNAAGHGGAVVVRGTLEVDRLGTGGWLGRLPNATDGSEGLFLDGGVIEPMMDDAMSDRRLGIRAGGGTLRIGAERTLTMIGDHDGCALNGAAGATLTLAVEGALTLTRDDDFAMTTGAFSVVKAGAGTLTLAGACEHTGGMRIEQGIVSVTHSKGLGAGSATLAVDAVLQPRTSLTTPVQCENLSVVDLSTLTEAPTLALSCDEEATVLIDVTERVLKRGDYLMHWSQKPEGRFELINANLAWGLELMVRDDGLMIGSRGMTLRVR